MKVLAAVAEELGDLEGHVVGIGPVLAAAGATRFLAAEPPEAVLLIGTCGAYPGGAAIGDVVVASQVGFASGVAALGLGYVPRPPPPLACAPHLVARFDGAPVRTARVLTCPAVSTDPDLVERVGDGWDAEHLEAYAVAMACHAAGVPFVAVLGIANIVGPNAHVEWLTHREAAQDAVRDVVRAMLADG